MAQDAMQSDIWIHRFIVVALFAIWAVVIFYNATARSNLPTDLLAGLLGLVIAYYFRGKKEEGYGKNPPAVAPA